MSIVLRRNSERHALAPFYQRWNLFDEMDKIARRTWDSWEPSELDTGLIPYTDVYEETDQLVVKAELPGINEEDLDIILEGDRLTIKAEKREETAEDAAHHTRERYYGQYLRSVTLPYPVKIGGISATFENGVLEIKLPKVEEVKAKKIEIKAQLPKDTGKTRKEK